MWSRIIGFSKNRLLVSSFANSFKFAQGKPNRDLYVETLGVSKDASQNDIKKAYYKLAQQYHPDKNTGADAKDKFSEINNAYETLSDKQKRTMYDQTGTTDSAQGGFDPFSNFRNSQSAGGFEDLFRNIFSGGGMDMDANRPQSMAMQMEISFEQSVHGAVKTFQYNKQVQCQSCHGSGAKAGTNPINCNKCQGSGYQTIQQGMMIMRTPCNTCGGQGKVIKQHCSPCKGVGIKQVIAKQSINIPQGVDSNTNMKLKGKGNLGGDLIIIIAVKKSPKFKREGPNVFTQIQLPVLDLILGTNKDINTIYGTRTKLNIPAGTQANTKLKIANQGFHHPNTRLKGDHYVLVKVKIPTKLTDKQKEMYEQIRKVSS